MPNLLRHIIGLCIGIFIFLVFIPFGLIELSKIDPSLRHYQGGHVLFRTIIALPFFIPGIGFMIWSNAMLLLIGKGGPTDGFNIAISPRTKNLVIIGPYCYTRNPMVFGAFCLYFAIAFFMISIVCLLTVILFLVLTGPYLEFTEEKRLLKDFGEEYVDYKRNVPRIIPIPWGSRMKTNDSNNKPW
jgi:protein-S-isoprenylcysteine O-methyltransferase Ste14